MPTAQHTRDCFTVALSLGPIILLQPLPRGTDLSTLNRVRKSKNTVPGLAVFSLPETQVSFTHWRPTALTTTPFLPCSSPASVQPQHTSMLQDGGEPNLVLSPKTISLQKTLSYGHVFIHCSYPLPSHPKVQAWEIKENHKTTKALRFTALIAKTLASSRL